MTLPLGSPVKVSRGLDVFAWSDEEGDFGNVLPNMVFRTPRSAGDMVILVLHASSHFAGLVYLPSTARAHHESIFYDGMQRGGAAQHLQGSVARIKLKRWKIGTMFVIPESALVEDWPARLISLSESGAQDENACCRWTSFKAVYGADSKYAETGTCAIDTLNFVFQALQVTFETAPAMLAPFWTELDWPVREALQPFVNATEMRDVMMRWILGARSIGLFWPEDEACKADRFWKADRDNTDLSSSMQVDKVWTALVWPAHRGRSQLSRIALQEGAIRVHGNRC